MADPKGFLKTTERELPKRRPVPVRIMDWKEVYEPGDQAVLRRQASRCMDCGVPFCHSGCPLGNLIPEWNDLTWRGEGRAAIDRLHATNNFPEFTGRLCPAPCESACVLGINQPPVTIKQIEVSIIDEAFAKGWVEPQPPARLTGKTVAVVGSGPAGLAAAQQLTRAGHTVAVFERDDRIGGLLRYGIPDFKMEKGQLESRLRQMQEEGTRFRAGVEIGKDISCNLGSMNIALSMDADDLGQTVETAIRALSAVSDQSHIRSVRSIEDGNDRSHAIGLGQMNLHGYLAREHVYYGSEEGIDFTNIYFYTVLFHALRASNNLAIERKQAFDGFEDSTYASGTFFDKYIERAWVPETEKVKELFAGQHIPTQEDWVALKASIQEHGIYNQNLQAVPPTGSISYINNSTSSIHPIASKIEIRKEGKLGRVYYPAAFMTNDNLEYYQDAYEIGYEKVIDTYAAATQHVDQGLSLTLFFKDTATTRDINKAQIYAWRKGIKTIYYIRLRQMALEGTDMTECVSCML